MKTMKKLASLLLALAMIFSLATTAFAQSIDIEPPANSTGTNTYRIYKVFDATVSDSGISYTLKTGKTEAPAGFTVANGYVIYNGTGDKLTAEDITAIAAYVTDSDLVATVSSEGTAHAVAENLEPGYYYITTSTGSVVTIDSTSEGTVQVKDKNTIPVLKKTITGPDIISITDEGKNALAQIGTNVAYKVVITVGKGATNYVFHDTMDDGLTLVANSVATDVQNATVNYTPGNNETFTITFPEGLTEGQTITITYSATINENALTVNPEKNTAYVSYGENHKTTYDNTSVYTANFTVSKKDGDGKALAGAGFVIKNADDKYYKLDENVVTWVESIDDADEHMSITDGSVPAFIGLANGTYTLVEKTVPAGYNKADDSTFTIAEHDYTAANLAQGAEVTNNAGTELPSTGGMGTTLFYVLGGIMVAAAVILLVTKKRMAN